MGKKETPIQNQAMVALSADGHYVERAQSGLFYTKDGRPVRIGIVGRPDVSGFHRDSGRAFFIEFKTDEKGSRATGEQIKFIQNMRERCALAGIARSVEEARQILAGWLSPLK